ncbi:hypothetical protein MMC28_011315 [Mycoblastus sanguinarius]|nr:hypothetical protein [Mycoblastus sanguinarius]
MSSEAKTPSDAFIFLSKYYRTANPQEPKVKDSTNEIWTKWPSGQKQHVRFDTGDMSSLTPLNEVIAFKNKNGD